jgi:DNA modification methylase
MPNTLYYGDNLQVLREHVADESVDLVYLDPPFKSNQDYNVLFAEKDGSRSAAQIKAFGDTWRWDRASSQAFQEVVEQGGKVSEALQAFRKLLGDNDMLAYLSMMAPRLVELWRVLRPTGSIYLHCDPTASHYLKILMDAVFAPINFRNEIMWRRTATHGKSRRYAPIHDSILFYSRSKDYKWNYPRKPYMRQHVEKFFVRDDKGWKTAYYGNVLTGSGLRGGESGKPWHGIDPSAKGRHWAIPSVIVEDSGEDMSELSQHQKLDRLLELGFITIVSGEAWPIYEHRVKPEEGQNVTDIWAYQPYTEGTVFGATDKGIDDDVRWLSTQDQERLHYQTQKPEGILERIIGASSDEGDTVLDPFCGCGTTVAVAERLKRNWIGIDITQAAIVVIKERLKSRFHDKVDYHVIGEPTTVPDADALAKQDPYQFQWWALGLVGARPVEKKKGADKGIDGKLFFHDDPNGDTKQIIISVKAGEHITSAFVRDLVL